MSDATDQDSQPDESNGDSFDPIAYGEEWLSQVFERMNFDIEVEGKIDEDRIYFDATGADADFLLGVGTSAPKSIEAVQTLLGAALSRRGEKRKVFLDVRGWREQRAERLEEVAHDLGEVAADLNRSVTVAGFNSYERAVVHQALSEDDQVRTDSDGRGMFRKLTIYPKN
ncbi:MAG: protein jag [Persicimonas sp.]